MASVSGHNATVNGNGNSPGSPDKQLQSMYQGLEMCLKDSDKTYEDKVEAVLAAWKQLPSFKTTSQCEDLHSITKFLYRDTLHLVLRCEWSNLPAVSKTDLSVIVKATRDEMGDDLEARQFCERVQKLVKNPWEDKTLKKILHANPDLTEAEAMEFCLMETPTLLSMRLNLLCDDNCEDLALKLVAWCRKCLACSTDTRFLDICSPCQRQDWVDLHVALLYQFKGDEMVKQLQQLTLEEGYQLVQRFMDRDTPKDDGPKLDVSAVETKSSGVWRNSLKIAEKASQIFMVTAMHRCPPPVCLSSLTVQLLRLERRIGTSTQEVANMIHTLVNGDHVTSAHMYIVGGALSQDHCPELRPLCIELYVRALNVDLNDLEHRRHRSEGLVTDAVRQAEMGLSSKFSALAELVKLQLGIHRECVLTAFSLNPTEALFNQLDRLAAASSAQTEERKASRDPQSGATPSADYSAVCLAHYNPSVIEHNRAAVVGEPPPGSGGGPGGGVLHPFTATGAALARGSDGSVKTEALASEDADSGVDLSDGAAFGEQEPASSSPLSSASSFSTSLPYCLGAAAALGISKQVMDDLSTVLHSGRWEVLSWNLDGGWAELRSLCLRYLRDPATMRSVTRELKFLPTNIDYRQFEHIPRPERDENFGIEKGYEIRTSDDEDPVGQQRSSKVRKRRKSSGKRSSYPASGESSDADPVPTAGGPSAAADPTEAEPKKKVLKKKVYKRIRALKTSSDSDSQQSPADASAKSAAKAAKKSAKPPAKLTRVVRTSSSRIDASHLDKIHANEFLTTPPSAAESSHLVKTLRMLRPEFANGSSWSDPNVPERPRSNQSAAAPTPVKNHSNNRSAGSSSGGATAPPDHFAPMLSTLNMNPKIVLTRTSLASPMSTSPKKTNPGTLSLAGTPSHQPSAKVVTYNIGGSPSGTLSPFVLLERLDKSVQLGSVERTMANLKGIDMFQVRPPPTAVHMVQLPNPPTANSHVATANGLLSSGSVGLGTNGGSSATGQPSQQQAPPLGQQPQEEPTKGASSTTSSTEDSLPYGGGSSANNVESNPPVTVALVSDDTHPAAVVTAPSASSASDSVTLVSTPAVSIFQVAHRPANHSNPVTLQPVAAVTGFNHPPPVTLPTPVPARAKAPAAGRGRSRGAGRAAQVAVASAATSEASLSQLLSQSSDSTESSAPAQTFNGPINSGRGQVRQEAGRVVRAMRRESQTNEGSSSPSVGSLSGSGAAAADSGPCRVPLVKYVDLDMVSSPTRPRPTGSIGMRRQSQGSNSNSPDPHQTGGRSSAGGKRGASVNPASPAINSPQSPALQAPPSPLSFRKQQQQSQQPQHYAGAIYRADGKVDAQKADRLASPSHPSQCSSPFSRPSSRSQDASPSPSELLGSMYPPSSFLPYSSSDTSGAMLAGGAVASPAASGRNSSYGGASPSQSPSALPALPKFQQAFGKKSLTTHFDILPAGMMGPGAALPSMSTLQDGGRVTVVSAAATSSSALGGNGYASENRRFVPGVPADQQPPNPPAEDEGLGSKLQSLLESALNGQISRSPTRHMQTPVHPQHPGTTVIHQQPQQQPHMVGFASNELLLGGPSPLDTQPADNESVSGGSSFLLSEQLREFESVFERVASTSHLKDSSLPPMGAWASDLAVHDHGPDPDDLGSGSYSIMSGPVADYLAPASNYSGSMDVSAASPVSIGAASALSATGNNSAACCSPRSTSDDPVTKSADSASSQAEATEAPLMQLLTVASAARQALADEEKCTNSNSSSNSAISGGSSGSQVIGEEEVKMEAAEEEPAIRPPSQAAEANSATSTVTTTVATSRTTVTSVIVAASDSSKPATRMVVLPAILTGYKASSAAAAPAESAPAPASNNSASSNSSNSNSNDSSNGSSAAPAAPTSAASTSTTATKTEATTPKSGRGSKQTSSKSSPAVSPGVASGGSSPSKSAAPAASSSSTAVSPAVPAASGAAGVAKPPQKAHDDEMTVLRVNAILEEYREQLRNSPDLQNKPAPRRRSNPLPSPSATTPKRRKSVQSKVKLLSQHAGRPADSASSGPAEPGTSTATTASSAESVAAAAGSSSNSSVEPPVESPSKSENSASVVDPTATTTTTTTTPATGTASSTTVVTVTTTPTVVSSATSVQVLNTSTISIPVSAVTAVADSSGSGRLIQHSSFIHTTTGEGTTFTTTPTISLGAPNSNAMPIMQQLLVTSQSGVRQVLLPLNNLRQALVARGPGAGTRFIYARHFVGVPARLATPITVRAVTSTSATQPPTDTSAATSSAPTSTTGTPVSVPAPEQRVIIQELLTSGQSQRAVTSTTGTLQWTSTVPATASAPTATETPTEGDGVTTTSPSSTPAATESPVKAEATGSVLRFVPTVNRVSLPVAPGVDAATLLAAASQSSQTVLAPPTPSTPTESTPAASTPTEPDPLATWAGGDPIGSPPAPASTSVDDPLPPVPLGVGTDEKLLNDAEAGVSEFLPCADFMGPGVSPSPCFSFSDSPLGSQNSSPATSPATFQASSAEEDSNNAASLDESGSSGTVPAGASVGSKRPTSGGQHNKSKILKRSEKPRVAVFRKDHGSMEYRRVGDGQSVVRPSHRRSFSRKQALSKQAAAAAAAANQKLANLQTPSPTPPTDTEMPTLIKEEVASPAGLAAADQEEELAMPKLESQSFTEDVASAADETAIKTESALLARSVSSPPMTEEDSSPPLMAPVAAETTDPSADPAPEPTTGRQRRQSRRCARLQKEDPVVKTESDSSSQDRQSPLKTKRRSSTRGHVKKNCPCCVSGNGSAEGKRTKSEPSASGDCSAENDPLTEGPKAAVKAEAVGSTAAVASAVPAGSKAAKTKKNAQRKR